MEVAPQCTPKLKLGWILLRKLVLLVLLVLVLLEHFAVLITFFFHLAQRDSLSGSLIVYEIKALLNATHTTCWNRHRHPCYIINIALVVFVLHQGFGAANIHNITTAVSTIGHIIATSTPHQ